MEGGGKKEGKKERRKREREERKGGREEEKQIRDLKWELLIFFSSMSIDYLTELFI